MTAPADRLLAAADLLDDLAGEATEGPWFNTRDGEVKNAKNWDVVDRMGAGSKDARYIAMMGPEVGKLLASTLREAAHAIENNVNVRIPQGVPPVQVASACLLDLADLLLAGAP